MCLPGRLFIFSFEPPYASAMPPRFSLRRDYRSSPFFHASYAIFLLYFLFCRCRQDMTFLSRRAVSAGLRCRLPPRSLPIFLQLSLFRRDFARLCCCRAEAAGCLRRRDAAQLLRLPFQRFCLRAAILACFVIRVFRRLRRRAGFCRYLRHAPRSPLLEIC